jgi:hypothetical protein
MHPFDRVLNQTGWFTVGFAVSYLAVPGPSHLAYEAIHWALAGLLMVRMARFYGDALDELDEDDDPYGMAA